VFKPSAYYAWNILSFNSEINLVKESSTLSLNKSQGKNRRRNNGNKNGPINNANEDNYDMNNDMVDQTLIPSSEQEGNLGSYNPMYNSNLLVSDLITKKRGLIYLCSYGQWSRNCLPSTEPHIISSLPS